MAYFYHGWFEHVFESLRNSSDSSRKQIFRDILEEFSYFIMKIYVVSTHKNCLISYFKLTYNYFKEAQKAIPKLSPFASWPSATIKPQWLKLSISNKIPWSQRSLSHWSLTAVFLSGPHQAKQRFILVSTWEKDLSHGQCHITETCLYNVDPLKPQFYIVKLGFTGVYIIVISAQNADCGYLLELPHWGSSNKYSQSAFWAKIWKISKFLTENFHFLVVKFSVYFITKTCLYNFDPLKPPFLYSKTGVYR